MADSIFTRIIRREIPAKIEYEDDDCIVIRDVTPQAPVHLLVIPKKPIATLNDLSVGDAAMVGGLILTAGRVMRKLGHDNYRTVFNCGAGAGQSVFHVHLHVLAGREFSWPPG